MTYSSGTWTVVIPIRPAGKSRLQVPGIDQPRLARAIALDTIATVAQVAYVRVVTCDPTLRLQGTDLVLEPEPRGINVAVRLGLVGMIGHRAALLGDLPALDPKDLTAALRLAEDVDLGAVGDVEGTGTTLVTASPGVQLIPSFGPGSWTKHMHSGFTPLPVPNDSTVRRDVDLAEHLIGPLGPRTTAVLADAALH